MKHLPIIIGLCSAIVILSISLGLSLLQNTDLESLLEKRGTQISNMNEHIAFLYEQINQPGSYELPERICLGRDCKD